MALKASRPEHLVRLRELLDEVFSSGYEAGSEAMRVAILTAAQAPTPSVSGPVQVSGNLTSHSTMVARSSSSRAPHGSVRKAIMRVLTTYPKLTEADLGIKVAELDPNVSPRSMGGELRRMRNRLYRFEGGHWFLIAQKGEKETAGPKDDPADLLNQTTKGVPDAEAPIAA